MGGLVEDVWLSLVETLGDFYLLLSFYFVLFSVYFVVGLIFMYCDTHHLLDKYKIQTQKFPSTEDYRLCMRNLAQNLGLVVFPLLFVSYPIFCYLEFSLAVPTLSTFVWHFLACVVLEDIVHYVLHRTLHIPFFYKHIHKLHHTFTAPFALAADFAHPLETLILGFATFSGPLLLRPHYLTFYCWVFFRQLDALATHCGYEFPNLLHYLPFYGGVHSHDYHHKSFIFNYSSRFTFMDHLFGTYKEPPPSPLAQQNSQVKQSS